MEDKSILINNLFNSLPDTYSRSGTWFIDRRTAELRRDPVVLAQMKEQYRIQKEKDNRLVPLVVNASYIKPLERNPVSFAKWFLLTSTKRSDWVNLLRDSIDKIYESLAQNGTTPTIGLQVLREKVRNIIVDLDRRPNREIQDKLWALVHPYCKNCGSEISLYWFQDDDEDERCGKCRGWSVVK